MPPGAGSAADVNAGERIFQVGFDRCGTTALAAFLARCGIATVHHDRGRLARRMRDNLAAGRPPLAGYERYRAFANMSFHAPRDHFDGYLRHRELLAAYGGRFVLNTRSREHWIASVMAHMARLERAMPGYLRHRFGTDDAARVAACWLAARDAHHAAVVADIPADRLLVFDIESGAPERLCDFAGVPRARAGRYRPENPTMGALGNALADRVPRTVKRALPDGVRLRLKRLLRA